MNNAAHATNANPATAAPADKKHAAGTIERIFDDIAGADGRQLPFQSKALAAYFVGKAQLYPKQGSGLVAYSFIRSEREICDVLDIDPKTFRKYLQPLVELGLVLVDKARRDGTRRFECKPLFERYRDCKLPASQKVSDIGVLRSGKDSRSASFGKDSLSDDLLRETARSERESLPGGSGIAQGELGESFPSPVVPPSSIRPPSLEEMAQHLGLTTTKGIELEIRFVFSVLQEFRVTSRRQRSAVKRSGIIAVAGAAAYVKQQQRVAKVENPAGLFDYAVTHGKFSDPEPWLGKVSLSTDDAVEPQVEQTADERIGNLSRTVGEHLDIIVGDLWPTLLGWLETRIASHDLGFLLKPARPVGFSENVLTLEVATSWIRDRLEQRGINEKLREGLETLIGAGSGVNIIVRTE